MDKIPTFEQTIAATNAAYDRSVVCTRENGCIYQTFSFNSMLGRGRFACCHPDRKGPEGGFTVPNCTIRRNGDRCGLYENKKMLRQ